MPSVYGEQISRIDERTKAIKGHVSSIEKKVDKINGVIDEHSTRLTKLEERQGALSVIGTSISTGISSGVALVVAWIVGSNR